MPNTCRSTRRIVAVIGAVAVIALSSCGSDDGGVSGSVPADTSGAASGPTDPPDSDPPTTDDPEADTEDSPAGTDTDTDSGPAASNTGPTTRTVEHALGTSEVPADPRRIVVLDSIATLDSVVALGADDRLVGRINLSGSDDPSWLDTDVEAIPLLGTWPTISIEEILTADPDLVIGYQNAAEVLGPTDERVPVVAVAPTDGVTNPRWQDVLLGVGDSLDESDAAEEFIAGYDARVDEVVAGLPDGFAGREVLVLLGQAGMTGFAMGPSATPAEVFERVGLEVSPSLEGQGDFVTLVEETVPDLPADVVLMLDFDGGATDWNAVLADLPAYAANPAIAEGVVVVDGSLWLNAGPIGQLQLLDEIIEVLAP